jgi:hypothetical protein
MSSSLVFNRVYRPEMQSVMLVFSTPLVNCCPFPFSLTSPTTPPLSKSTPPPNKRPEKTTFRDWCLYSSFVHGSIICKCFRAGTGRILLLRGARGGSRRGGAHLWGLRYDHPFLGVSATSISNLSRTGYLERGSLMLSDVVVPCMVSTN